MKVNKEMPKNNSIYSSFVNFWKEYSFGIAFNTYWWLWYFVGWWVWVFFFLFFSNHMNQTSQLTFLKNSTHLFFSQLLSKSLGTCFSHQTLYEILHTRCDVVWQMSMWTMLMKCDFVVSSKNLDINCSARIDAGVQ